MKSEETALEEPRIYRFGQFGAKVGLKLLRILHLDKRLSDEKYLSMRFLGKFGYPLNLDAPVTFNEKLQWLKIHDRNPLYQNLVDKVCVKEWVADKIGAQHVPKTLNVWASVDEIDIDDLPSRFVLKTNHDSGGVVVCKNRKSFDLEAAKTKLSKNFSTNYYWAAREKPYENIIPKVFAEEYLGSNPDQDLVDYKVLCSGGEAKYLFSCTGRSDNDLRVDFFDIAWNHLPFTRHYPNADEAPARPARLEAIIDFAERLSEGMPFVRVDFYLVEDEIFFGEMTFYPGAGFEEFEPWEWDARLGSIIDIESVRSEKPNS